MSLGDAATDGTDPLARPPTSSAARRDVVRAAAGNCGVEARSARRRGHRAPPSRGHGAADTMSEFSSRGPRLVDTRSSRRSRRPAATSRRPRRLQGRALRRPLRDLDGLTARGRCGGDPGPAAPEWTARSLKAALMSAAKPVRAGRERGGLRPTRRGPRHQSADTGEPGSVISGICGGPRGQPPGTRCHLPQLGWEPRHADADPHDHRPGRDAGSARCLQPRARPRSPCRRTAPPRRG